MMTADPISLIGRPETMKIDFQGFRDAQDFQGVERVEMKKDRFNAIFSETRKMKARSSETERSREEGRVDMPGTNSAAEVQEAPKKADLGSDEIEGEIQYYLEKGFNREGIAEMADHLISLVNHRFLSEAQEGNNLFNVPDHQPLILSSSLLDALATVGLATRTEGMMPINEGLKAALPVLEHAIIEQVAQKLSLQKLNLNGKEGVTLELEPKELGRMKIEIAINKGSVTADIVTQHIIVKEILERNLSLLHDGMRQSGFNIDQFSVNVGDFRNQSNEQWNGERFHFSDSEASNYLTEPLFAAASGLSRRPIFGEGGVSLYI